MPEVVFSNQRVNKHLSTPDFLPFRHFVSHFFYRKCQRPILVIPPEEVARVREFSTTENNKQFTLSFLPLTHYCFPNFLFFLRMEKQRRRLLLANQPANKKQFRLEIFPLRLIANCFFDKTNA